MKYRLFWTSAVVVLLALTHGAGPAQSQTTAPGPYYATPSWDQTIACTTTSNCPRFIVLSNMNGEAVLDRETGLVWDKTASSYATNWTGALATCNLSTRGNRNGWRLPTVQELLSLMDQSGPLYGLALPSGHPFQNVQSVRYYWSASSHNTANAWRVKFDTYGNIAEFFDKLGSNFVWCVRGGQGVDPQ